MKAHPKEGKCKYKVSCKSSAFGTKLTEKNRSTVAVCATTVHVVEMSVSGQSRARVRPARPARRGGFNACSEESL